jgi:hypothetical protein
VKFRLFVIALAVAALSGAGRAQEQQAAASPTAPLVQTPSAEQVRNQVRVFETSLRAAVENAARTFGVRVREAVPNFNADLIFINDPIVTGLPIPDVGVVFHVQIPALSTSDALIMSTLYARQIAAAPRAAIPVSQPVGAASAPTPVAGFEPNREYTDLTREALYDAVLDNALALPIPDGQTLTVFAGELLPPGTSPLAQRSRLLILTIKGEDLLALRRQQINRDQARERIKESRFGG